MNRTQISIESPGTYPTKARTLVSDVARYQNDGTDRITPSRFIERAEDSSDQWSEELGKAMDAYVEGGGDSALKKAGDVMAKDISDTCDRIDTGRLKRSFVAKIRHEITR